MFIFFFLNIYIYSYHIDFFGFVLVEIYYKSVVIDLFVFCFTIYYL